jgi:7-cyano-7-deazaguanine synthase in queuosine biosynthesis
MEYVVLEGSRIAHIATGIGWCSGYLRSNRGTPFTLYQRKPKKCRVCKTCKARKEKK